jgi:hypothetical protein
MTKLWSLLHPCSIGKKLIQNLFYGPGFIDLLLYVEAGEGHLLDQGKVRDTEGLIN